MEPNNFDREKLDLEKEKFNKDVQLKEAEFKLKEEEFDLKKKELRKNRYKLTQVHATIVAACVTILGPSAAIYVKYRLDQQTEKQSIIKVDPPVRDSLSSGIIQPVRKTHPPTTTHVFICNSKTAGKYHKSDSCYHLKACKSKITKISQDQAHEMGRELCGDER
jgi:uncharacterized protein involved in tolerance to divalent cations